MPTSKIVACTDGSIYAPSVYQYASWAAQRTGSGVHVLHMLNPHYESPVMTDLSGTMGFNARQNLLDELVELEVANARIAIKRGEAILQDAEEQLHAYGAAPVSAEQKHGALSEFVGTLGDDAELVVLGKRGNNANFEKGHLGSNLERVIRGCPYPVLVASRDFRQPERFLLAFDGGESSRKAVDYAVKAPLLQGMHCSLLYVGNGSDAIEGALSEASSQLLSAGFEVAVELRAGEPEKVIESVVDSEEIDLLVMGAYGHSPIRHLFVGSTTTALIRSVKLPVLLFR